MKYLYLVFALLFVAFGVDGQPNNSTTQQNAIIDLKNVEFTNNQVFELNGKWGFVWNHLLEPNGAINLNQFDTVFYKEFPFYWNNLVYNGKKLSKYGYGTFFLSIKSPENYKLQIELDQFMTAYACYLNGRLVAKNGVVGNHKQHRPQFVQQIADIQLNKGNNLLIVHVSNYSHRYAGAFGQVYIGKSKAIFYDRAIAMGVDFFLIGAILIMALYHLGLYWLRRKDKSALYFGLYSLVIAVRTLSTGTDLLAHFWPDLSWEIAYKLDYLSFYIGVPLFFMFISSVYPPLFSVRMLRIYQILGIGFSLIVLATTANIYSLTVTVYQVLTLILIFYVTQRLIVGFRLKQQGIAIVFIGTSIFLLAVINDILYARSIIHTAELTPLGLFLFIFSQSYLLSQKFSAAFYQNELLTQELDYKNKNLEKLVEERTQEISQQNEEIKAQTETLEDANAELEKLSIVASETDNAVIIMDKNGNFEWINSAYTRIYGGTIQQILNSNTNIFKISGNENLKQEFEQSLNQNLHFSYESTTKNDKGNQIWTQTTITPIFDPNNKLKKLIAIDSDISAIKIAEMELKKRSEEVMAQKLELELQNKKIEIQNNQIKASIVYAQTIQQAILPTPKQLEKIFDFFLVFKPKDIVSGDFYWFTQKIINNHTHYFLAVVDCTGHGVPGAFMSMIASRMLSEIVNERNIHNPADILENLDSDVNKALKQNETNNQDGMDLCLVRINELDSDKITIDFAGAKRPLFYYDPLKSEQIQELKASRRSVGGTISRNKIPFDNKQLVLCKSSTLYLSTDGFSDQNNPQRKRIGTAALKQILFQIRKQPLNVQKLQLVQFLLQHQRDANQRDDITFLGVKIK